MGILLAHSGHFSTNLAEFKHHSLPTVGYHIYPFVTTVPLSSGGYIQQYNTQCDKAQNITKWYSNSLRSHQISSQQSTFEFGGEPQNTILDVQLYSNCVTDPQ